MNIRQQLPLPPVAFINGKAYDFYGNDVLKADYLRKNGWREVQSDAPGKTCWLAPVGNVLYFALDDAYELETEGVGIHAIAAQQSLSEALRADDLDRMEHQEAIRFAETGVQLGIPPNF